MDSFNTTSLTFRRKILKFVGASISIKETESGKEVGFIQQKAFKLKEDIRIFSDATKSKELMQIKARSIIDLGATYDMIDTATNQSFGAMKREGISSMFVRDKWLILDANGTPYAQVEEEGTIALLRRYIEIVPLIGDIANIIFMFQVQKYSITYTGQGAMIPAGVILRKKNPFVTTFVTDTSEAQTQIDQRVIAGIGAMLCVIDASKN